MQRLDRMHDPAVRMALDRLVSELSGRHSSVYEMLQRLDRNGDGLVSREELRSGLLGLGLVLGMSELDALMRVFDTNMSGRIDFREFYTVLTQHCVGTALTVTTTGDLISLDHPDQVQIPVSLSKGDKDGQYFATLSCTVATQVTLHVFLRSAPFSNSPCPQLITPAATFAPKCYGFGSGISNALPECPAQFQIQTADRFGNLRHEGGADFRVRVLKDSGAEESVGKAVDRPDGTVDVMYTVSCSGVYEVHATLGDDDVPMKGSPWRINVPTGPPHAPCCNVVGHASRAGLTMQFPVQVRSKQQERCF